MCWGVCMIDGVVLFCFVLFCLLFVGVHTAFCFFAVIAHCTFGCVLLPASTVVHLYWCANKCVLLFFLFLGSALSVASVDGLLV